MKSALVVFALPILATGQALARESESTVDTVSHPHTVRVSTDFSLLRIRDTDQPPEEPTAPGESVPTEPAAAPSKPAGSGPNPENDKPDLSGFGFGLGVNYVFEDEIEDAFLDSQGVIKTIERTRGDTSFILEGHFLAQTDHLLPEFLQPIMPISCADPKQTEVSPGQLICGSGPYLAIKTGGSTILVESVAVGWMWGVRHNGERPPLGGMRQFNFGVGISIDPSVKRLAQGFEQNSRLPPGETAIRFENDMTFGAMMLFSIGL